MNSSTGNTNMIFKPTMNLRYAKRTVKLHPFYKNFDNGSMVPGTMIVLVLQQQYIGTDGSTKWVDVPEVMEDQ